MIEALKSDTIADRTGGRFKLCALVQRRLVQLMEGARPLVDRAGRSDLEIAIDEIMQQKITFQLDDRNDPESIAATLSPEQRKQIDKLRAASDA